MVTFNPVQGLDRLDEKLFFFFFFETVTLLLLWCTFPDV